MSKIITIVAPMKNNSATYTKKPRYPEKKSFESVLQEALIKKGVKVCDIKDKEYPTLPL